MGGYDIGPNPFRDVRESLNISIKEFSKVLGISYMNIIQTEQGLIKRPFRYARALERDGLIESADVILTDQWKWLFRLRERNLQRLKDYIKK